MKQKKSLGIATDCRLLLAMGSHCPQERGLTLTEVVAAALLAGIALVLLAPPLAFVTATRIQNRRIEQARLLAQEEIDRVQAAMTFGVAIGEEISNAATDFAGLVPPAIASGETVFSTSPPTSAANLVGDRSDIASRQDALLVDIDSDGGDDFFVQAFRDLGQRFALGDDACDLAVFQIGVRVYAIAAQENLGNLQTQAINSGTTNTLNAQRTRPLYVLYAEASRSDTPLSAETYRNYINNGPTAVPGCPFP